MKFNLYPRTWAEAKKRRRHVYMALFVVSILAGFALSILIYHSMDLVSASAVNQLDSKAQWAVEYSHGVAKNEAY